jgi:hypothetical protein
MDRRDRENLPNVAPLRIARTNRIGSIGLNRLPIRQKFNDHLDARVPAMHMRRRVVVRVAANQTPSKVFEPTPLI